MRFLITSPHGQHEDTYPTPHAAWDDAFSRYGLCSISVKPLP